MEQWVIEADHRHTVRRVRAAMQGNAIRALVELITNADDSYIRLEEEKNEVKGEIEIEYKKDGYCGIFAVRDYAEGMSIDDVRINFKGYGAATSGLKTGKGVRGYFGQGAKDALAGIGDGGICTFKNNQFVECQIFIIDGKLQAKMSDSKPATTSMRAKHKIDANGTVAYFKVDRKQSECVVPRFDTVHQELANNAFLRRIMTNHRRKIFLLDVDSKERRPIRYEMPQGKEIMKQDFVISYGKFGNFPIHFALFRSDKELMQTGDDRDGGLLLVDEKNAVLGISLFKYDNEPLATRFFGEVQIDRFRELLKNEEAVLDEERDGIAIRHPFCQKLISEIERRLEISVQEERARKQREEQTKFDREETTRYRKAFSILNKIAEEEAEEIRNLGQDLTKEEELPPNGFCLYPSSAEITVGKRYNFELRANTKVVNKGSNVKISSSHPKVKVITSEIKLLVDDRGETGDILHKYITIEGLEPNVEGVVTASVGNRLSQVRVHVVPEKEFLYEEGMVFAPESITLRPNQPRRVNLLIYVKMIGDGSEVSITSDNNTVHVSREKIVINDRDAIRHVVKYELEVWGDGPGQDAIITAEFGSYVALLEIRVRSKEEEDEKNRQGMFSDPDFDMETKEPHQRSAYSKITGKVTIYTHFSSVKHYLGESCQYKKTLVGQVLIADLVAERCFGEIAQKKVDSSPLINPAGRLDRIQSEANKLSNKYGKKIHEALVDQGALTAHLSPR
jgi:hypothetical protein